MDVAPTGAPRADLAIRLPLAVLGEDAPGIQVITTRPIVEPIDDVKVETVVIHVGCGVRRALHGLAGTRVAEDHAALARRAALRGLVVGHD